MNITNEEYKKAQEAWVSDCTGGSTSEVISICFSSVASHILWSCLSRANIKLVHTYWAQVLIYCLPTFLCQTIAADYTQLVSIAILLASALLYYLTVPSTFYQDKQSMFKSYLTVYRGSTMIMTCIAILAVDFPIFPRRFAKVETFGTSLMDVGVGSFVFSSGLVSSRAYLSGNSISKSKALLQSFKSSLPILVLGGLRLVLTKGVDYQTHTSEYGLHWNFFFTLGFLPCFVTLVSFLQKYASFGVLALGVGVLYETALQCGLETWILEAPRVDLLSANKEGVFSFFGYLSIFLLGLDSGLIIFKKYKEEEDRCPTGRQLIKRAIVYWAVFIVWTGTTDFAVSRRLANGPYVLWVVAFNMLLLATLVFVDDKFKVNSQGPSLLFAMNQNGLVTFLVANLLTGLVNLSMRTLYCSTLVSFAVCSVYILAMTFFPWTLWTRFGLRLKI
ncbi:GWT1-domain-containing protein [Phycomyces nitens]|nr:GWT1-domain-containing protein [Phycomyces nitens]